MNGHKDFLAVHSNIGKTKSPPEAVQLRVPGGYNLSDNIKKEGKWASECWELE